MAITNYERVGHTLLHNGAHQTGRAATLTLRIMRDTDLLVWDWDADDFVTPGTGSTEKKAATEHDATDDPGFYYWELGTPGGTVNHVYPEEFSDSLYRFELEDTGLSYRFSFPVEIRSRRVVAQLLGQSVTNDKILEDGAVQNYHLREDDGVNDILTRNVKDKSGGPVTISSGIPAQEKSS